MKKIFFSVAVAALVATLGSNKTLAASADCPTCSNETVSVAAVAPSANSLGINVSAVLRSSGLSGAAPSAIQFKQAAAGPTYNWNGTGDLPGAFQRPWELAPNSNFDPSFRTSFWMPETGPINVAWAPWNWPNQIAQISQAAPVPMVFL